MVLVGKNGINKSFVIKVLFGCLYGKNIICYWFIIEIDEFFDLKFVDGSFFKFRYIYGYKNVDGCLVEIF